jgi:hypothetical protein
VLKASVFLFLDFYLSWQRITVVWCHIPETSNYQIIYTAHKQAGDKQEGN